MDKKIQEILSLSQKKLDEIKSTTELEKIYIEFFGKNSPLSALTKQIAQLPPNQKPKAGQAINKAKSELEKLFEETKAQVTSHKSQVTSPIDISAPGKGTSIGHLHLASQAIEEIVEIFSKLGYYLQSYPEIDWDWYAFESLNMPKDHPARDDWETFFIKANAHPKYGLQVLTPHTSNGQVREMERVQKPPIRMINIARCYRRQIDVSHTPMFHQFEGLLVDENVSIPDLKGTFNFFTQNFFGPQRITRLRPHHFRFTEPSFEVDVTCGVCLGKGELPSGQKCKICKSGWLELGGAGMVHPKVLKVGGIDPKVYSGFAFGWGIERTIAMKTSLPDIRLLYQNDIRFLEQF